MIIKVCGMRDPENIRQVEALDIDWMGFNFDKNSTQFVPIVPSYLPTRCQRVGVFVNTNKDGILLRTAACRLDILQLCGEETPGFVKGVRQLLPDKKIVRAFAINGPEDFQQVLAYEGLCDYYLFEMRCSWKVLDFYLGKTPFILSGSIDSTLSPQDLPSSKLLAGINLNSEFEKEPGLKNVELLQTFIRKFRR